MNNEHQGMKIGLISLTIVAIIFIGTTIFLFTKQKENQDRTVAAEQKASSSDSEMRKWMQQAGDLKKLIGPYSTEQPVADIQSKAGENVASFSGRTVRVQFPNSMERNYENLTAFLASAIDRERQEVAKVTAEKKTLEQENTNLLTLFRAKEKELDDAVAAAQDGLTKEQQQYTAGLSAAKAQQTATTAQLQAVSDVADAKVRAAETEIAIAVRDRDFAAKKTEDLSDQLLAMRQPMANSPDGQILFIDQSSGLVWINLGFADGLEVRTTFSVYDPAISDVTIADRVHSQQLINRQTGNPPNENICSVCLKLQKLNSSKANIEVVEIKGPHSAVARILTDELANPVAVSDVIFTPVWQPGQRQKFALIGNMSHPQLRTSNMSAMDVTRNLIETNGGEVVAWVDEKGNLNGTLDVNTTFLIVGGTDNVAPGVTKQLDDLRKLARMNGTIEVPLAALIRRMGYKQTSPITGFGEHAMDNDREMVRYDKVPTTSSGKVADIYGKDVPPMTTSSGKVADIYLDPSKVGAPKQSSGTTSDMFRRRTIPGERTE